MSLSEIQESLFSILVFLDRSEKYRDLNSYKLALVTMDVLNNDHKNITGCYFIEEKRVISYHEKQWSIKWIKF